MHRPEKTITLTDCWNVLEVDWIGCATRRYTWHILVRGTRGCSVALVMGKAWCKYHSNEGGGGYTGAGDGPIMYGQEEEKINKKRGKKNGRDETAKKSEKNVLVPTREVYSGVS